MKRIGLIGGIAWPSTRDYYESINKKTTELLGGLNSPEMQIRTVNLAEYAGYAREGHFDKLIDLLVNAGISLERSGVDFIIIVSNTGHMAYDKLCESLSETPVLHIADCCAVEVKKLSYATIGLLGTKYTMTQPFWKDRLEMHGLTVLAPEQGEVLDEVQRVIEEELSHDMVKESTKAYFIGLVEDMIVRGAQCIVLGCTELILLFSNYETIVPILDSAQIHCNSSVSVMLNMETISDFQPTPNN
eukprot:TRINITY_DN12907_c0_g1_i1.p1 TRINITY_DN12907_c0_g1~~TRINITY_DN12907_c0_g1_i1.p1  ORF type:complete len:245 (-),score=39.31 TRINITY_DN12907_c0_g1_i1:128-862(-)